MNEASMLAAIMATEKMIRDDVAPAWVLACAARVHRVDCDQLAMLMLRKVIDVARARAAVRAMDEADAEIEMQKTKHKSERARRCVR